MKLTGAMLLVMMLDSVGYLLAVGHVDDGQPGPVAALEDIFVAVALLTITVGLVLPGMIAHTAVEVAAAADRLATGTLADFTRRWRASPPATSTRATRPGRHAARVVVHTADELGRMADQLQHDAGRGGRTAAAWTAPARSCAAPAALEHLAATDPLTGLSNRRHFEQELEKEVTLRTASSASVDDPRRCWCWTSTTSSTSTTATATRSVTSCCRRSRSCSSSDFAPPTSSPGSAATSSRSCSGRGRPTGQPSSPADLGDAIREARFPLENGQYLRLSVSIGITTFGGADDLSSGRAAGQRRHRDVRRQGGRSRPGCLAATDVHQERARPGRPGPDASGRPSSTTSWSCTPSRSCTWHQGR